MPIIESQKFIMRAYSAYFFWSVDKSIKKQMLTTPSGLIKTVKMPQL
jgi:hypothetical protein